MTDQFQHDPDLEAALRSRSGGDVALSDARAAVLGRATTIRRRRLAVVTGAGAIVLIGGVALATGARTTGIDPADQPITVDLPATTTVDDGEDTPPSTIAGLPAATATSTPSAADTSSTTSPTTSSTPGGASPGTIEPAPTTTAATPTTTTPSTTTPTTTTPSTGAPTTTTATTTTATTTAVTTTAAKPIAPFTKTYESAGGAITVNWNGSALSLVSTTPAAGFDPEIENDEPRRIRVRFRSDDSDWRIEVRISDGQLIEEIS